MEESYWWVLPKTVKNCRNLLKIEVLCWLWYTLYALLFTNLSLSHLWYPSLVFNISKLLKASDYFAKVCCQNYDIFWTCITFRTTAKISEPLKNFLINNSSWDSFIFLLMQWSHKITPPCFTDYFKPISSVHSYYTHQSLNENLFVNPVQTTQYGICSLRYIGTTLWNSLPINVKQITPFFRFCQNIKNSMTDGSNSVINS